MRPTYKTVVPAVQLVFSDVRILYCVREEDLFCLFLIEQIVVLSRSVVGVVWFGWRIFGDACIQKANALPYKGSKRYSFLLCHL